VLPVLPVLRVADAASAVTDAERLIGLGVGVVELTATTPGWPEAVGTLRRDHPQVLVGLGTVRDPEAARRAVDAGAQFLVSPHLVPEVRAALGGDGSEVPLVEGGFTPTEVATAASGGLAKLFPAHVGGPAYLHTLLAVLPDAELVPTGGIGPDDVEAWLDAGAVAVGVGSALTERLARDPGAVTDWLETLRERSAS